jgi:fructose-1,6-bisphosphatase/inositol monophosphatase family enzyme
LIFATLRRARLILFYELILRPWDIAGATLILKEAGGINLRTLDGGEIE